MMIIRAENRSQIIGLYPIYAAVMPVLLYYNTQAALEIPPGDLIVPVLVALLASIFVYFVSCLMFVILNGGKFSNRIFGTGALFATSVWIIFYSLTYCVVLDGLFKILCISLRLESFICVLLPLCWIAAILPVVFALVRQDLIYRMECVVNIVLLFFTLIQLAVLGLNCISYFSICRGVEALQVKETDGLKGKLSAFKPDIFYIVLDQMAGLDGLKVHLQYDDDWFYAELEKRGFFLARKALSNYPLTRLSIASSLNLSYLDKYQNISGPDKNSWTLANQLIRENNAARFLKKHGYDYILIDSGFSATNQSHIASRIEKRIFSDFFSEKLLSSTLLSLYPGAQEQIIDFSRSRILNQFDELRKMSVSSVPKFVFSHIFCPHEPYIFGSNGEPVYFSGERHNHQWTQETRNFYIAQLEFIQKKLLGSIDKILVKNPDAIIIVQGDHGTHCSDYVSGRNPSERLLIERFSILNAYKVPPYIKAKLTQDIEPVNSFVLVFNGLFQCDIELSPNRQIYSSYDEPYLFKDVTDLFIRHHEQ